MAGLVCHVHLTPRPQILRVGQPERGEMCDVQASAWRGWEHGVAFEITANRFLHHMVRFLVGTMLDIATGRRPVSDMRALLEATDNSDVSPPVAPHALFLEAVEYPAELYLT